jgi:hypothetical protein
MLANAGYTPQDVLGLFFTLDSNYLSEYCSQNSNKDKTMKTKTIRLIQVVTLIGFSHSGTYNHTIKDIDDNTFSGYDAETEL